MSDVLLKLRPRPTLAGFQYDPSGGVWNNEYLDAALNEWLNAKLAAFSPVTAKISHIPDLAASCTVTGLALAFTPLVVATIIKPVGGLDLYATVVQGSQSPDGFQFTIAPVATDSDQYLLGYLLLPQPVIPPIGGAWSADSTVVTADSTIITADSVP